MRDRNGNVWWSAYEPTTGCSIYHIPEAEIDFVALVGKGGRVKGKRTTAFPLNHYPLTFSRFGAKDTFAKGLMIIEIEKRHQQVVEK